MASNRRTKIVCTLGPASDSKDQILRMIQAGMDVARLNFSHGTYDNFARVIADIRELSLLAKKPVAILQDLQGPKIRTGSLLEHIPVQLETGAEFTITTRQIEGNAAMVSTTYSELPHDVRAGDTILLSDGLIELQVISSNDTDTVCKVIHGGSLAEHQGINLPGVKVSAEALTEKDRADLAFGIAHGVDYVALSFVRRPEDLETARAAIQTERQKISGEVPSVPLIAKIEKPEALDNLDAILKLSDGVMVARGDLGVEIPLEQVPLVQKKIILRANELGIPVITATQMLDSMIQNPRPTRAEVSDVANAILDGSDAVMLSGETATGKYPIDAVTVMSRIAVEMDNAQTKLPRIEREMIITPAYAISNAARVLADESQAKHIVVFTRSGSSAHLISKERPGEPIIALTPDDSVLNKLALWWGVTPRKANLMETTESLIIWVDMYLQVEGLAQQGDRIVILGGMPVARKAKTNFVKLHRIGDA